MMPASQVGTPLKKEIGAAAIEGPVDRLVAGHTPCAVRYGTRTFRDDSVSPPVDI